MAILPIIEKGDPILDNNAKAVEISEINSPKKQKIIKDMNVAFKAFVKSL